MSFKDESRFPIRRDLVLAMLVTSADYPVWLPDSFPQKINLTEHEVPRQIWSYGPSSINLHIVSMSLRNESRFSNKAAIVLQCCDIADYLFWVAESHFLK